MQGQSASFGRQAPTVFLLGNVLIRLISLLAALSSTALALPLVLHYPLGVLLPGVAFVVVALVVFRDTGLAFVMIPAVLPIVGLAPWTGWITFEELDLLVLAAAAGGYARLSLERQWVAEKRTSVLLIVLAALFSLSVAISMARGIADAGGFAFGWFQGYDGPMNSMRIGKSFFLALLLLPLLIRQQRRSEAELGRQLSIGMVSGLVAASMAAVWERLAFTQLLNFSSDYRTTAMFWEMHVGGAALDGWLLLTFPFALWLWRRGRSHIQLGFALAVLILAAYAALTTFSRGVYLALVLSFPLLAWQTRHIDALATDDAQTHRWPLSRWTIATALLATASYVVFPTGGYRALLALLGLLIVSLQLMPVMRSVGGLRVLAAGLVGVIGGGLLSLASASIARGPYVLYALLLVAAVACLYLPRKKAGPVPGAACVTVCAGLLASTLGIAGYWGGPDALYAVCAAVLLLIAILTWGMSSKRPLWPSNLRWQGSFVAIAVSVFAVVSVFAGGAYMGNRFATSATDFESRVSHWQQGLSMLSSTGDWLFGKGLGRYPANYYFAVPNGEFPGTYRVLDEDGNSFISLVSSRHPISFGNILRISQRLDFRVEGPFRVKFKARAKTPTELHFEVCAKHLLYSAPCAIGRAAVKATAGQWVSMDIPLSRPLASDAKWYLPRIKMFSFGIARGNSSVEVDDVVLTTLDGHNLLENGGFSEDMRRWFFTSERDHLPWHAKNLMLNLLFDQGAFGLAAFLVLTIAALWRLNIGKARHHELSPYLTSAIIGFQVVGLFDSLTDVPRLAFAYYMVVLFALSLRTTGERDLVRA